MLNLFPLYNKSSSRQNSLLLFQDWKAYARACMRAHETSAREAFDRIWANQYTIRAINNTLTKQSDVLPLSSAEESNTRAHWQRLRCKLLRFWSWDQKSYILLLSLFFRQIWLIRKMTDTNTAWFFVTSLHFHFSCKKNDLTYRINNKYVSIFE